MSYQEITHKIIAKLNLPKPNSHKRDNGRLLIIAGSDKYFGSLIYCVKAASRLADLIYLLSTKENQKLIKKLKLQTAEFMPVGKFPDRKILTDIDCILIGPGLGTSASAKRLTSMAIKSNKKAVLDADALNVLDDNLKKNLSPLHILTPHHKEFYRLFQLTPTPENTSKMAKKYHCTIILKGPVDVIAEPNGIVSLNKTGNAGMTKGGTGDVLAGLVSGLYCTNSAYTSAAAGTFINGLAGDELYKKSGTFYNAEDLVNQIPKTLYQLTK